MRGTKVIQLLVFTAGLFHGAPSAAQPCASGPVGLLGFAPSVKGTPVGIDVHGTYAYVADWGRNSWGVLQVFDVSDPCNPVRRGTVETPPDEIGDLAVVGNHAFLANDALGVTVYDTSNPDGPLPRVSGRADGPYAHSIFFEDGRYALVGYIYSGGRDLAIYDMTTFPSPPVFYNASADRVGAFDEYAVGSRAYVFDVTTGGALAIDIVDISNPMTPTRISSFELPTANFGSVGEVRVQGNYVYVAQASAGSAPGGLRIIDISDELHPYLSGRYDLSDTGYMDWKGIGLAVDGNRAYVGAKGGLHVFDITDRTAPSLAGVFAVPEAFGNAMAGHVEIREHLAFVTVYNLDLPSGPGGLAIYKVSDEPPVADAGPDHVVSECTGPLGAVVTLDGSNSYDPEGGTLEFLWNGPFGTLTGSAISPIIPLGTHTITLTVTDPAGSTATDTVSVTILDTTPPVVTCAHPDGTWHTSDVTLACAASDSGSGLASHADASFLLTAAVPAGTESPNVSTDDHQVCDNSGNCATAGPISGNMIDKKAPDVGIAVPHANAVYTMGQVIKANYGCVDGGAGVQTCLGPLANGQPIVTSVAGAFPFLVTGADRVGHLATASAPFTVAYDICVLFDPWWPLPSGIVFPVALRLCDINGRNKSSFAVVITALGIVATPDVTSLTESSLRTAARSDTFYYSPLLKAYVFNVRTKGLSRGSYELQFRAGSDPTTHSVTFRIR